MLELEKHVVSLKALRAEASRLLRLDAWSRSASHIKGRMISEPLEWWESLPRAQDNTTILIDPDAPIPVESRHLFDGAATLREYAGGESVVFAESVTRCEVCWEPTTDGPVCEACIDDAHEDALIEEGNFDWCPEAAFALMDYEDSLDEDVLIFDPEWYGDEDVPPLPNIEARG